MHREGSEAVDPAQHAGNGLQARDQAGADDAGVHGEQHGGRGRGQADHADTGASDGDELLQSTA